MSVSGFERDYVAAPGARQIYARPLGNIAASMIGVAALCALGLTLFLGAKTAQPVAQGADRPLDSLASAQSPGALPGPGFDLSAPELAREKKVFSARELDGGLGREDSVTIGQFASSAAYLRLDVRAAASDKRADFFLDLTRHAAAAGLAAIKIGQPSALATRFGAFEAADIRLSLASTEGAVPERACVALRLAGVKSGVEVAGFACGAGAKPFERHALSCIIDRLERKDGGGNAAALDQLFQNADRERGKPCGSLSTATTDKESWIDAHSRAPEGRSEALPPKHTKKAR